MPPEDKPPMPPLPKTTVRLEVPPDWAIALSDEVKTGFRDMRSDIASLKAEVGVQGSTMSGIQKQVAAIEFRVENLENRQETSSIRAKSASEVDLKHEAAIATLATKVDTVEAKVNAVDTKVDTLSESHAAGVAKLVQLTEKPLVRKLAAAAAGLAITALGIATSYLAGHQQQPAPPTPTIVIAPAPTASQVKP